MPGPIDMKQGNPSGYLKRSTPDTSGGRAVSDVKPESGAQDNVQLLVPGDGQQQGKKPESKKAPMAQPVAAPANVTQKKLPPIAGRARMKRRHWGLVGSFFLMVLAPLVAAVFYLWIVAEDQYVSTVGYTVRSQEGSSANDLLGGLASFAGTSTASDNDILYEFIQSQEMVEVIDAQLDLRGHYSRHWPVDRAFSLWPDASLEDLVWYWQRVVSISYDSASGLTEVQVVGFDAEMAQAVTRAIVAESQTRINALNAQARADAMSYAQADLGEAIERLKSARESLTEFRTRTQIVDPNADIQGRMGVMNNLQQQLAEALIEYDLLRASAQEGDPRLKKARQRIDVIRDRIAIERQTFTSTSTENGGVGEDYPSLISEFERLTVDLEYGEAIYRAGLTALEVARDAAARQSRYLAIYIKPTRAEDSQYPQRFILAGLIGLFLMLGWSVMTLIYYSIRDRS